MHKTKKRGAPAGNSNRQNNPNGKAESHLHIRCLASDKAAWVKAAQGQGLLSAWVIDVLNRASDKYTG